MKPATILLVILLIPGAFAISKDVTMTNQDYYTAQFQVLNTGQDVLKNCIPYWSKEFISQPWVTILPNKFDMQPSDTQDIIVTIEHPTPGYYQDTFQVKCQRYIKGSFAAMADIISPQDQIQYTLLVNSQESVAYQFKPAKQFYYIAQPGTIEKATFSIVNLGTQTLPVFLQARPQETNQIFIEPHSTNISPGQIQQFKLTINVPKDFDGMNTSILVIAGPYQDSFSIIGQKESLAAGGPAIQSIIGRDVELGPVKIPVALIILGIIVAGFVLFRENKKEKKR